MRICEITAGVVTNVIDLPAGYTIAPDRKSASGKASYEVQGPEGSELVAYDASYQASAGTILAASDEALPGWSYADGLFVGPETQGLSKAELTARAADRRWRQEVGGITVAGVPVATDDRAKLMITGARVAAMADPDWSTVWHGADGQTYPVDAAAMVAISDAVQAHVNSGFATFAAVKAAIEAGTITTAADIDAAFAG
nr:DUF4376 domain-containing protein [Methylobacterium sp. ZNC0032]